MVAKHILLISIVPTSTKSPTRRGGLSMHGGYALTPCGEPRSGERTKRTL